MLVLVFVGFTTSTKITSLVIANKGKIIQTIENIIQQTTITMIVVIVIVLIIVILVIIAIIEIKTAMLVTVFH